MDGATGTAEVAEKAADATGGHRVRHRGGKKGLRRPSGLLRDMRIVLERDEPEWRNRRQKELGAFLKEDRRGFMTQLAGLEKVFEAGKSKAKAAEAKKPEAADEGAGRAREAIDALLAEWEAARG